MAKLTGCDSKECTALACYEVYVKASRGARLRACHNHLADMVELSFQQYEKVPRPVIEIRQFG